MEHRTYTTPHDPELFYLGGEFCLQILVMIYGYCELKRVWDELHLADNQKLSAGVDKSMSWTFMELVSICQGHLPIAAGLYSVHVRVT